MRFSRSSLCGENHYSLLKYANIVALQRSRFASHAILKGRPRREFIHLPSRPLKMVLRVSQRLRLAARWSPSPRRPMRARSSFDSSRANCVGRRKQARRRSGGRRRQCRAKAKVVEGRRRASRRQKAKGTNLRTNDEDEGPSMCVRHAVQRVERAAQSIAKVCA